MEEVRLRSDGTIDCEYYALRARERRSAYERQTTSLRQVVPLRSKTKRRLGMFGAAFAVATGAFWATMLTTPPTTEAANPGFSISDLQRNAPRDLSMTAADAH